MHFPVAHYAEETGGLAACVTSFSGCSAVLLNHPLSEPSHCESNWGPGEGQADWMQQLQPMSPCAGQETNRSVLGGPE